MRKGLCFILGIVIILGVLLGVNAFVNKETMVSDDIPEKYLFVFHGGSGELTKSTYIYKIDNEHANMGFKYINTENYTKYWGSSERIIKIVDQGEFVWTDGAFTIAKKHGAYSYIIEANNDKSFTIEEYQKRFIMN